MNKEQPYLSFNMIVQNEAKRIEPTLKCIKDIADEIVIIDGGSKDNTVSLCKKYTDKVYYNNFSGDFAFQKNFANFKCSGRWIFNIDADETLNPQLIKDLKDLLKVNENIDIFYLARLNKIQNLDMKYVNKWGWTLTPSNIVNEKIINTNSDEYKYLKNNGFIINETPIK